MVYPDSTVCEEFDVEDQNFVRAAELGRGAHDIPSARGWDNKGRVSSVAMSFRHSVEHSADEAVFWCVREDMVNTQNSYKQPHQSARIIPIVPSEQSDNLILVHKSC